MKAKAPSNQIAERTIMARRSLPIAIAYQSLVIRIKVKATLMTKRVISFRSSGESSR